LNNPEEVWEWWCQLIFLEEGVQLDCAVQQVHIVLCGVILRASTIEAADLHDGVQNIIIEV
jgi:hypothetical protein